MFELYEWIRKIRNQIGSCFVLAEISPDGILEIRVYSRDCDFKFAHSYTQEAVKYAYPEILNQHFVFSAKEALNHYLEDIDDTKKQKTLS